MADCHGSSDTLPDPGPAFTRIIHKVDSLCPRPSLWIFGGDAYYSASEPANAMVCWQVWKNDIAPIARSHELPTSAYQHRTISWLEEPDDIPEETEVMVLDIQGKEAWSGQTMSSSIHCEERGRNGRVASGI